MTSPKNIRIAALGAAAVALAAGGAAVAASKLHSSPSAHAQVASGSFVSAGSGSSAPSRQFGGRGGPGFGHRGGDLDAAATYLGVTAAALRTQLDAGKTLAQIADATSGRSAAGLIDALVAAEKTEIAADVKAGRITQAQADTIIAGLKDRVTAHVNATGPGPGGPHGHGPGDALAAAATYLGITQDTLMTQLQSGKTLGQVADATSGKSKAGLIAALVATEKAEVAQAVKDGKLTQSQADRVSADLEQRVAGMVDGTFRGRHGHDGPPPGAPAPSNGTHI